MMTTSQIIFTALIFLFQFSYMPVALTQNIINGPDVVYVTYSPAIYITQAPAEASPPPTPGYSNTPMPNPTQPPIPSPTVDSYLPATPINLLSCASIGEPWWGCLTTENCEFDDAGDPACCPVGEFCRGVVNDGDGAGPRSGLGTGAWSAGTRTFGVSDGTAVHVTLLAAIWCVKMVFLLVEFEAVDY